MVVTSIKDAAELKAECDKYYGTENHILTGLTRNIIITDGINFLRQAAGGGAFWLVDLIASYQNKLQKHPMLKDFQLWTIEKDPKNAEGCIVTCHIDTDQPFLKQEVEYTDFPLDDEGFKLYVEPTYIGVNGVERRMPCILLPTEH